MVAKPPPPPPAPAPSPATALAPDWVAVDWGTSRLRAWAMRGDRVLEARSSGQGMGTLEPAEFEPALLDLIRDWIEARAARAPAPGPLPVIACGMVGARGGWVEAAYRAVPCPPLDPADAVPAPVRDPCLTVRVLPGLCQAAPPDVMRGEETQIAGFLRAEPGFHGTLCLPGTHSKWVTVAGGVIGAFRSFMTGELYALLSGQSVLRHTIRGAAPDPGAFAQAAHEARARPEAVAGALFGLRARSLLDGLAPGAAAGRLSGLLIGAELAGARDFWQDRPTVVIGADALAGLYAQALSDAGAEARRADAQSLVLAGLISAAAHLIPRSP